MTKREQMALAILQAYIQAKRPEKRNISIDSNKPKYVTLQEDAIKHADLLIRLLDQSK